MQYVVRPIVSGQMLLQNLQTSQVLLHVLPTIFFAHVLCICHGARARYFVDGLVCSSSGTGTRGIGVVLRPIV